MIKKNQVWVDNSLSYLNKNTIRYSLEVMPCFNCKKSRMISFMKYIQLLNFTRHHDGPPYSFPPLNGHFIQLSGDLQSRSEKIQRCKWHTCSYTQTHYTFKLSIVDRHDKLRNNTTRKSMQSIKEQQQEESNSTADTRGE